MGTVRYTVINGAVLSENRNGTKRDYLPDPLGSTLALLDNTQTKTDTFAYWPYGEVASRTGTTATPLQYVGTQGYYKDSSSRTYVRARTLDIRAGRWMTQDPIGFEGGDWNLYRYVGNRPTTFVDPSGLDCLTCASHLDRMWHHQWQHDCNAKWVHCLACCVLKVRFGGLCATTMQRIQCLNRPFDPAGCARRLNYCRLGQSVAPKDESNYMAYCIAGCSRLLPFPDPTQTKQKRCKEKLPPGGYGPINNSNLGDPLSHWSCELRTEVFVGGYPMVS